MGSPFLLKGPVALGRIFVYFAKKTVNKCCRRVRPTFFALTKFCPTLTNFKEAATKNRGALGLAEFLSGDFIVPFCLFSVTKSISTFHTPLTRDQKCAKLKSTSVQQAWTLRKFRSLSVSKFRFSAVSRSSWRWAVHAITDR